MKNLVELITSNEWNALTKKQRIDELQRQIDELKNETEYPVFCYLFDSDKPIIVRFDGLKSGEVIKQGSLEFGHKADDWNPCTNKNIWEPLSYNKERGLYHTQLVWVWDKSIKGHRVLCFYNAVNDSTFNYKCELNGVKWNNYEPYQGEWPQWAIEAHKTLEGLND